MSQPSRALQRGDAAAVWWRVPMVWLVVGGPAAVVVAGITTAVIAFKGADPVVTGQTSAPVSVQSSELPALQARNQGAAVAAPTQR